MSIAARLAGVQAAVIAACREAGRAPESVRIVAASKGHGASAIGEAAAAGQGIFGENYARELREKRLELAGSFLHLEWHFIGRVQTGNAKEIATASLVHGVGSIDQARALAKHRRVAVLLQLSLWDEASKNGFSQAEIERDLDVLRRLEGVELRGFMAMPPPNAEPRAAFAALRSLAQRLAPDLRELSMGMSGDFREAILEGATLVRIGTAIFGPRAPKEAE